MPSEYLKLNLKSTQFFLLNHLFSAYIPDYTNHLHHTENHISTTTILYPINSSFPKHDNVKSSLDNIP